MPSGTSVCKKKKPCMQQGRKFTSIHGSQRGSVLKSLYFQRFQKSGMPVNLHSAMLTGVKLIILQNQIPVQSLFKPFVCL